VASPSHARRLPRLFRTARYLPWRQIAARLGVLRRRRRYARDPTRPIRAAERAVADAGGALVRRPVPRLPDAHLAPEGNTAVRERAERLSRGRFRFLRREADYSGGIRWRDPDVSPLWAYQLQYLGPVLDLAASGEVAQARRVLASWSAEHAGRWDPVAWHPYPVSVRVTNLCLAGGLVGGLGNLGERAPHLVALQAAYLLEHLEGDVRGNHLFENAAALLAAGETLDGEIAQRCRIRGEAVLERALPVQVLADGAHFELSPMYHVLVLHRLLQLAALRGGKDHFVRRVLRPAGERMAGFLAAIVCPDGDVPLLGDSVRAMAPPPDAVLKNARELGWDVATPATSGVQSLAACGLHVWRGDGLWAVLDAGRVCPDALPAHGQADTLTLEVWIRGHCLVGDPGVHDYTGPERAWGRSSRAHSTITLDDADNSEVYDSFRVGGRARVLETRVAGDRVDASMRPWSRRARLARTVRFGDAAAHSLEILDEAHGAGDSIVRSRLHLHPRVAVRELREENRIAVLDGPCGEVHVRSAHPMHTENARASREFGLLERTTMLVQQLLGTRGAVSGSFLLSPVPERRRR
jgi:uncharacterized heparinase superfamily protein